MNKDWLPGILGCVGILFPVADVQATPPPMDASPPGIAPLPLKQMIPVPYAIAQVVMPASAIAPPEPSAANPMAANPMAANPMARVRSVDELSDVRSSDWAYQALKRLVERYGILTGYSDLTFRGDRPLTRYEFVAVLRQVFDRVEQQLTTTELIQLREDFATIRRLVAVYGKIATDLRDRLNKLDPIADQLTQQQFSTTTQLSGQAVLALTDGSHAQTTVVSRVRLNLRTQFSPTDALVTQLEVGNNAGDAVSNAHDRQQNLLGTLGLLADGGGLDYVGFGSSVRLSKLSYTFQPAPTLSLTVGARLNPRDFIDYNRFANESAANFSSSFFTNNPLIVQNQLDRPGGAGAVLVWKPSAALAVRGLYVAADADRPSGGITEGGLFGDRYQGSVEVEYAVSRAFTARLQFTRATVNNTDITAGGINAEWLLNRQFGVFARVGIAHYEGFNPLLNQDLDLNPKTWAIGVTVRRILIPGSTAGIAIGQPFVERNLGNATQTNVELYYSLLLNDSISFTPALLVVTNPNNRASDTIWQWAVRLVYAF